MTEENSANGMDMCEATKPLPLPWPSSGNVDSAAMTMAALRTMNYEVQSCKSEPYELPHS